MIDPKHFWSEPSDEIPAEMMQHIRVSYERFGKTLPGGPGVTEQEIADWERNHRVQLPELLANVLRIQNGGAVRDTNIFIEALPDIAPVAEHFWEWADIEEEFASRALVFSFAHDDMAGQYLLNYNACGPRGEPSVYLFWANDMSCEKKADSVEECFAKELGLEEETDETPEPRRIRPIATKGEPSVYGPRPSRPCVHWSETDELEALFRENLDLTHHDRGVPATCEHVLCRKDEMLVFFEHMDVRGQEESYTRTALPLPLVAEGALGAGVIAPLDAARPSIWTLHLQPRDSNGIVSHDARMKSGGRWKNETCNGAPIYVQLWSADRTKLEQLRLKLLGAEAVDRVRAFEEECVRMEARPDEFMAAALERTRKLLEDTDRRMAESKQLDPSSPDFDEQMERIFGPTEEERKLSERLFGKSKTKSPRKKRE
jgi:SMI1/KNR4 family protein SUKH-1